MKDLEAEFYFDIDVLSKTLSSTLDIGQVENKELLEERLKSQGWKVTKEEKTVWTISKTQT